MAEQIFQAISDATGSITQAVKKRIVCLYRVSTIGQVDKDDIPMQKQYCREFCKQHPGWEIVKEFSEKGVSGFKVSAKDRDAVQEIQKVVAPQSCWRQPAPAAGRAHRMTANAVLRHAYPL